MRADDEADLFAIYGDEEVMRYASDAPFPTVAMVATLLDSVAALLKTMRSIEWAVAQRSTGRAIGTCGLHSFDDAARSGEMGCLLARAHWGQGLMAEALVAVMAYGRDTLGLHTVVADIALANRRSMALYRKLGFQRITPTRHMLRLVPG